MSERTKLNDLPRQAQLDILARKYLIEYTTKINKEINKSVYRRDSYNTSSILSQIKNQFLCGTSDRYNVGYSTNPNYELDRLSLTGALFYLKYKDGVSTRLKDDYSIDWSIGMAYADIKKAGYVPFWAYDYQRYAWRESFPSSVMNDDFSGNGPKFKGRPLSSVTKRAIASTEEFEEVIAYIKTKAEEYMTSRDCDQGTIDSILAFVDTLPKPEIKVKSKTSVKKPKAQDATIISLPASPPQSMLDPVEAEEAALLKELEGYIATEIRPTGMYDKNGTPLGENAEGNYCYPNGDLYTGTITYWEDGSEAHNIEEGLFFDNDPQEEEDVRIVDYRYDGEGHLLNEAGGPISVDGGYTDEDEQETKKDPKQLTLEDFGVHLP